MKMLILSLFLSTCCFAQDRWKPTTQLDTSSTWYITKDSYGGNVKIINGYVVTRKWVCKNEEPVYETVSFLDSAKRRVNAYYISTKIR